MNTYIYIKSPISYKLGCLKTPCAKCRFHCTIMKCNTSHVGVAKWWAILAAGKELSTFLMGVVLKRFGAYGCVTLTGSYGLTLQWPALVTAVFNKYVHK